MQLRLCQLCVASLGWAIASAQSLKAWLELDGRPIASSDYGAQKGLDSELDLDKGRVHVKVSGLGEQAKQAVLLLKPVGKDRSKVYVAMEYEPASSVHSAKLVSVSLYTSVLTCRVYSRGMRG